MDSCGSQGSENAHMDLLGSQSVMDSHGADGVSWSTLSYSIDMDPCGPHGFRLST